MDKHYGWQEGRGSQNPPGRAQNGQRWNERFRDDRETRGGRGGESGWDDDSRYGNRERFSSGADLDRDDYSYEGPDDSFGSPRHGQWGQPRWQGEQGRGSQGDYGRGREFGGPSGNRSFRNEPFRGQGSNQGFSGGHYGGFANEGYAGQGGYGGRASGTRAALATKASRLAGTTAATAVSRTPASPDRGTVRAQERAGVSRGTSRGARATASSRVASARTSARPAGLRRCRLRAGYGGTARIRPGIRRSRTEGLSALGRSHQGAGVGPSDG